MGAISALAGAAAKHVLQKGASYALSKIKKKARKKVNKVLGGGGGGGGGGSNVGGGTSFSKINKAEVNMIKRGMVKEKGTQAGAYSHAPAMASKKTDYAMSAASHPQKKLLTESRALSYGKHASMKTRR